MPVIYWILYSKISPPVFVFSSISRAANTIFRCVLVSPGAPRGLPSKLGVNSTLGRRIIFIRVSNDLTAIMTVGIPDSSSNLATCPTDMWQTGQTGTRSAASICAACNNWTHFGPVLFGRRVWEHAPTNEYVICDTLPIFSSFSIAIVRGIDQFPQ